MKPHPGNPNRAARPERRTHIPHYPANPYALLELPLEQLQHTATETQDAVKIALATTNLRLCPAYIHWPTPQTSHHPVCHGCVCWTTLTRTAHTPTTGVSLCSNAAGKDSNAAVTLDVKLQSHRHMVQNWASMTLARHANPVGGWSASAWMPQSLW